MNTKKGKRMVTLVVCIAIAMSLTTAEQSDAIIPAILGGVALGLGIAYVINKLLDEKKESPTIQTNFDYDKADQINKANYRTALASHCSHWEYLYDMLDIQVHNNYQLYNNTFLFHARQAEYDVLNYLNYTNWTKVTPLALQQFDDYSFNLLKTILEGYCAVDYMASVELLEADKLDFVTVNSPTLCNDDGAYFLNMAEDNVQWNNTDLYSMYCKVFYSAKGTHKANGASMTGDDFNWYNWNLVTISSSTNASGAACYVLVSELNDNLKCFDLNLTTGNLTAAYMNFRTQDYFSLVNTGLTITISVTNQTNISYTPYTAARFALLRQFRGLLQTMAIGILHNAYATWDYCHKQGWYSIKDVPPDYIVVPPDIWLDNPAWINQTGLTYNDTSMIWLMYLGQMILALRGLNDTLSNITADFYNLSEYDDDLEKYVIPYSSMPYSTWQSYPYLNPYMWENVTDEDSEGGKNITFDEWWDSLLAGYPYLDSSDLYAINTDIYCYGDLKYYNDTGNETVYFENHNYSVYPLQRDLTLIKGKTYNATVESQANITDGTIKLGQQVIVFDIDNYWKVYTIRPQSYYHIVVEDITDGNTSKQYFTWERQSMDDWTYGNYGFNLSTLSEDWQPTPTPTPTPSEYDWETYKPWIVIGLFVGGILMMAIPTQKKHNWIRVLGVIALIAGIGLGIYWYIYPTIANAIGWLKFW